MRLGLLGGLEGDVVVDAVTEIADARRGSGGTGGAGSVVVAVVEVRDVRDALRAWNGSMDARDAAVW